MSAKTKTGPKTGLKHGKNEEPPPQPKKRFGRRYRRAQVVGGIFGGLIVLSSAYVAANWLLAERVTAGTTVAGIDIGGQTKTQAIATLESALSPRAREPIQLTAGQNTTNLDPVAAGLSFDADATVGNLVDFSLRPTRLISHIRGGSQEGLPVVHINEQQLTLAAQSAARALHSEPRNGTVVFSDSRPVATEAQVGLEVSPEEITEAVRENWLQQPAPFALVGTETSPAVSQAATDAAYTLAQHIVSQPLTVVLGQQQVILPVADLAAATTFTPTNGELVPQFRGTELKQAILDKADNLIREPQNAHIELVDNAPVIVGGAPGTDITEESIVAAISQGALAADRIANVELIEVEPEISVATLEALGVSEVVSSFDTPLTANVVRTNNLRRGAELINGKLLLPGETFSLLSALNPINAANGFGQAGIIVNGVHQDGMGGGLSQLATTAYNAGFFAGFEDVVHRPHSVFISRYPAGREATIVNPSLDMQFRNNTPYGALIQSWVANNRIHVAIWSTPYFRVETSQSARSNVRAATTNTSTAANCTPQSPGAAGFTITNRRQVFRLDNDALVIDESNTWTYRPDNGIRCASGG
ncbi:MAG: VanW family protein [Cellulomonadaceae bacterium]|jgi:vancomycin resistance protein YoaR|nr:VanW family protein [Cellulomonadaceae bacterium]